MRLPNRFWEASIDKVNDGPHLRYIKRYLSRIDKVRARGYIAMLWGENGVGKTAIASLLLKEARRRGYTGLFLTMQEYMVAYHAHTMFDDTHTIESRCKTVDFLVIDDLGKEAVNQSEKRTGSVVMARVFEELMRYRHARLLPTIITANITPEEFREQYTTSLLSLLKEDAISIKVVGPSHRERNQQKVIQFFTD